MDFTKTKEAINNLPDEQKPIALSVLKDIEYWSAKVEQLQGYDTFEAREVKKGSEQIVMTRKTPVHDMLKEAQRMKLDAMRTLTQIFNKDKVLSDDSPLAKMLEEYA